MTCMRIREGFSGTGPRAKFSLKHADEMKITQNGHPRQYYFNTNSDNENVGISPGKPAGKGK